MRAVVQRVQRASVTVEGEIVGSVGAGLCVFLGVGEGDEAKDARALAEKVVGLRIFSDVDDKMNLGVLDAGGAILAISQFTLFGDVRRGKRPSFTSAMEPEGANVLFDRFCTDCRDLGARVETGTFRAHMDVELINDGPVTILLDTTKAF